MRSPPVPIAQASQTVDVEDMPLAYLPGNALRVRVRVAGEMAAPAAAQLEVSPATL